MVLEKIEKSPKKTIRTVISFFKSPVVFGSILFTFFASFPPFDDYADVNLAFHMFQHIIIVIAGAIISYHLFKVHMDRTSNNKVEVALSNILGIFNRTVNRKGYFGILIAGGLIALWHVPYYWDLTVFDPSLHVLEHFIFLIIGLLVGASAPILGSVAKIFSLIAALSAHMYGGFALYILATPVYTAYSLSANQQLGFLMVIADPFIFFFVFFLVVMQSHWARQKKRIDLSKYYLVGSILMVILIAGYFGYTFVQLSYAENPLSAAHRGSTSVVYIEETPYYWNYNPRNLTVVIGVNSTVVWQSKGYSTDTVTSYNGLFSSPNIGPGQSWFYTFTSPGTYRYYCIYHPWMSGAIKVLS
jgi:plastocyanin/cytochrome c oxidase assembly factor CtaG